MTDATIEAPSKSTGSQTIRPGEAAHFGALAADWWDARGSSAMLHKLNPVRLGFVRSAIDRHWGADVRDPKPLEGKTVLDVGCGAGLLCEPLARMGAAVTGLDAAAENVAAARAHAEGSGLAIDYRAGELGEAKLGQFDLVTSLEVLEHVADKPAFLRELACRLAPDGLMILSTPNRTAASRLLLVGAAETTGAIPRGTHHWGDFITPDELEATLTPLGLKVSDLQGIAWRPGKGLHVSGDLSLNYILSVQRA